MTNALMGYWCLHCELITLDADVKHDEDGDLECPHCEAGEWDLWRVRGSFQTGTQVETSSDYLDEIRVNE